jgi:hypothetical protein
MAPPKPLAPALLSLYDNAVDFWNRLSLIFLGASINAALAQLVEHIIRNDGVGCSNHPCGTNKVFPSGT